MPNGSWKIDSLSFSDLLHLLFNCCTIFIIWCKKGNNDRQLIIEIDVLELFLMTKMKKKLMITFSLGLGEIRYMHSCLSDKYKR